VKDHAAVSVQIEIPSMRELQAEISSDPIFCECELHKLVLEGRGVPVAHLVLVGIAP